MMKAGLISHVGIFFFDWMRLKLLFQKMWSKYNHPVNTTIALSNTGDALAEGECISWIRPAPIS